MDRCDAWSNIAARAGIPHSCPGLSPSRHVHARCLTVSGMRRRRRLRLVLVASALTVSAGVAAPSASAGGWHDGGRAGGVRLNQIQVVGTHNSYHLEAPPAESQLRASIDPAGEQALQYGHRPIAEQLAEQDVRQIELDVWADPDGGLYANPLIRYLTGGGPYDPAMARPGTKVLHIQDIDYHSSCLTFRACLQAVKAWSDRNRGHVPVAILVELKDAPIPVSVPGVTFVTPVPWTAERMDGLDREIRSVFRPSRVLTPDDVRGRARTLERAVTTRGWPTLAATRGDVLFLMDNAGAYRTDYLRGHPSLRGRVMFTDSAPGQPDAAFVKENDPTGANAARIRALVRRGYVVRTRADADTVQARTGDTAMRDAALASGAQWVSTDYPAAGTAARFGTDYAVTLPRGLAARCNPVTAPRTCRSALLEPPLRRAA